MAAVAIVPEESYIVWNELDQTISEFESTVFILTMGGKPIGVYSTPELASENRDKFIEKIGIHTNIDFMFEVQPFRLNMPVDITRIRVN